jgi:FAD/FMN-containing dehydrogenase
VLAPLRSFRKPIRDSVAATPYVQLQASSDDALATGRRYYLKGGFVQQPSQGLTDTIVATIAEANLPVTQAVSMPQGGGAYARVKGDATAFAQRAAPFNMFVFSGWEDPAQSEVVGNWTRNAWKKLEPHTRGFYVNEYNDDAHRMRETYGGNYDRLVALKTKFDPSNLFRMNANVPPKKA